MAKTRLGLIQKLDYKNCVLTPKGRKIAAADANWAIRLKNGGWDQECYWSHVAADDLRGPVEYCGGIWSVEFPWGGTYYCPAKYVKKLTKMGLKRALRKMGR
jgi:hypothetical protein